MSDIETLRRILANDRTIAVVGLSAEWHRPSFFAAKYLQEHGYRIVPVNPRYDEVLGERCYASLRDIPHPVDMVDVFRRTADVEPIAEYQNEIVAVRSGSLLGTSFHPELTDDSRLHSWFLTFSAVP